MKYRKLRINLRSRRVAALIVATIVLAAPSAVWATHQFSDVADSNPFAADIEWLADVGVTNGCGPDVFCPEAAVTRQQMAAFMYRLATYQVVDAATALTADSAATADTATWAATAGSASDSAALDGRVPATYDTFVVGDSIALGDQSTYTTIGDFPGSMLAEVSFNTLAPDSVAAITASASFNASASTPVFVWLEADSNECLDYVNAAPTAFRRSDVDADETEEISITVALEFPTQGPHSVAFCAQAGSALTAGVLATGMTGVVSASPTSDVTITTLAP